MKLPIYLLIAAASGCIVSCNSDDDSPVVEENADYSNLIVSRFNLQKDDSVLAYLDSVFFSIDLDKARIFNADSLPKGTDISRLRVNMSLPSVSEAELTWRTEEGKDSTISYLTNPNDSIDFSRGPVKLRLKSFDKKVEFTYNISVNVHLMDPDSLYWNQSAVRPLPTSLQSPETSRAIEYLDGVVVVTAVGNQCSVAYNANPGESDSWTVTSAAFPVGADLHSLNSKGAELYVVGDRKLWRSSDRGATWTDTGVTADFIYGACGDYIVGVRRDVGGQYVHMTYPSTVETPVEKDCPVRGTSLPLVFTNDWSTTPMMLVTGGRTATGDLVGATWGYDNGAWAKISNAPLPGGEDIAVFPYFTFKTSNKSWKTKKGSALFAITGGKVYLSADRGIHWILGSTCLQLPDYMPKLSNAQALVFPTMMYASRGSDSQWREMPSAPLSPWYEIVPSGWNAVAGSRATTPITQWECPYIYIYGGYDTSGRLSTNIWRGVINRLSFKPLQ